jgi:ElaB/YqjD/DUF883 family membrane-anchored ribosome-binding protein
MDSKELAQINKLSDIDQRRAQLKQELRSIEREFEGNIDDIKESIQQKSDPRHWIRRYPMAALGIAVGMGILLGSSRKSKKSVIVGAPQGPSLFGEMKRMLMNRGIAFAVSSVEDLLSGRFTPPPKPYNSEEENLS